MVPVHVEEELNLYSKVYPVAPETADQLKVAPLFVILLLERFMGDEQEDEVEKDDWANELPLAVQLALTRQS